MFVPNLSNFSITGPETERMKHTLIQVRDELADSITDRQICEQVKQTQDRMCQNENHDLQQDIQKYQGIEIKVYVMELQFSVGLKRRFFGSP